MPRTNQNSPAAVWLLFLLLAPGAPLHAAAADPQLIEAAKKEGKLMIYSSVGQADTATLSQKFQQKYPFVKPEYLRLGSERLLTRILQEARAGKTFADVFQTGVVEVYLFKQKGLVAKHLSPERAAYADSFKDSEGYYTSFFHTSKVIAYNTKLVSADRAPKSYEDLLHPQWKEKLGMPGGGGGVRWFLAMMKEMGDERGEAYMKRLAAQKPVVGQDISAVTALMAAGEYPVVVFTNGHQIEQMKRQGAPVEWVPTRPVLTTQTVLAITSRAANPGAARLYVDYILSKEGQEVLRSLNRLPARADVEPDPPRLARGLKFSPYRGEWGEEYDKYAEKFRRIFE
ncbi:MAG TPA: extracellular solute-binding protein [Candidatus Acidoferrales bacterium]|nr:extracellular solute-binding protein [Candidatus Acidoferrales bacterium]